MKTILLTLSAFAMMFTQTIANAKATTVSHIKSPNLVCFHISKPEALVFKTSAPQKIWKTLQDKEGKIKTLNALQLGISKMDVAGDLVGDLAEGNSFKAQLLPGYQLSGAFENQTDGEVALSVTSTYLPDGNKSNITDQYNCSRIKN